jgi:hypothetical protein
LGVLFTISLDGNEVFSMVGSGFFSFYGRFHIKMFKKACLRGKEKIFKYSSGSYSRSKASSDMFI